MTQFIVKNTSSQKKTVTVLGLSILYGASADLMLIAGVTDNTIGDSLLKGELKTKITSGDLVVVSSTVLVPSEDPVFTDFLVSCGLGTTVHPEESKTYLTQSTWYIDPVNGKDNRNGKTSGSSIKTWAEWRRRVGETSTLKPTGGLLTINILGDMPPTDPIMFTNMMAPDCSAIIQGYEKAITQPRNITAAVDENPLLDQYWAITDSGLPTAKFFSQHIGRMVKITSGLGAGSRAIIARDAADLPPPQTSFPKTAHMSNWISGSYDTFDVGPGQQPNETSKYQIIDYPVVYIGAIESHGTKFLTDPNALQMVMMKKCRIEYVQYESAYGGIDQDGELIFQDCIHHLNIRIRSNARNFFLINCSTQGSVVVERGWFNMVAGCHQPQLDIDGSGGIDCHYQGEFLFFGANPTFVGKNLHYIDPVNFPNPFARVDASINGMGIIYAGMFSVWDSFHTLLTQPGGRANLGAGDFFFGDPWTGNFGVVPFWGKGNVTPVFPSTNSEIVISQFQFGVPFNSQWNLPRVGDENANSDFEAWSPAFDATANPDQFFKLDVATGLPTGTRHYAKFSDFQIGGYFQSEALTDDPNFHLITAKAVSPLLRTTITFGLGIYNP